MKLVQDLPEIFDEFGEKEREGFLAIKEYKEKGVPVIGMYCAYFPSELAMAVGAIPVGLCSFSNDTVAIAEKDLPKSMCPLVKSSYGFALSDRCPYFHFSDLVIGETTCDGKKKMYEMMAEFKPVFVMELPNSQSERGVEFWRNEIIRTKEYLEEFFHVTITEQKLREAVHLNNEIRMSLKNICEVMKLDPAPMLGEDIQKLVRGSKYRFDFESTPALLGEIREQILKEYQEGKKLEKRPRILVTGCPIGGASMKVIHEIEENGGVVVAVENCSGVRTLSTMVEEDTDDIYEAIARKYLSTGCSIMTPNDNRIDLIGEIIDEYHVDGVVEMILSGCHSTGAESVYIRRFVTKEKHLPYIAIDTDYSPADTGRITTRLGAFLEMIEPQEEEKIDIGDCYKIILTGFAEGKKWHTILDEIYKCTRIPIWEDLKAGEEIFYAGESKQQMQDIEDILMKEFPNGEGRLYGGTVNRIKKAKVEQLLDILAKGYQMKKPEEDAIVKEKPDFLWIVGENQMELRRLYQQLSGESDLDMKVHRADSGAIYISEVQGFEGREKLIQCCNCLMEKAKGQILIGNGFAKEEQKEENRQMQMYVFELARKKNVKDRVLLMEDYYHELAISYISRQMGDEKPYLEELEKIRKEDQETGKELYETLYWYLRMKRNVAQTAVCMKLHRNTLLPRLTRINEIMDLDAKDGMECGRLLLAMEIERAQNIPKTVVKL